MKVKKKIGPICGMKRRDGKAAPVLHGSRIFNWDIECDYTGQYSKWFTECAFEGLIADALKKNGSSRDIVSFSYEAATGEIEIEFRDEPQDVVNSLKKSVHCSDALTGREVNEMRVVPKDTLDEAIRLLQAKYTNP